MRRALLAIGVEALVTAVVVVGAVVGGAVVGGAVVGGAVVGGAVVAVGSLHGMPQAHAQTGNLGEAGAITVEVGGPVEAAWVGNANGWFCDDPSLLRATIQTGPNLNYWVVEGVKPGRTVCRVGTELGRASFVFAVTVTEPTPKPQG